MGLLSTLGTIGGFLVGGPAGASLGGAIGGGIDGYQSSKAADQYSNAQNAAMQEQARLYGLQADMGEYFFDQYQDSYAPLAEGQLQAAQVGLDPQYYADRADASVMSNYSQVLDMSGRNLARSGVSPNDGRFLQVQNDSALGLASARVAAQNQARNYVGEQNWNRRNQQVDFGAGLVGSGASMVGNAAAGFGSSAAANGKQAGLAGQAAGNSWNGAANGFVDWWNGKGGSPSGSSSSGGSALSGFGVGLGSSGAGGFGGFGGFGG